MTEGQALIEELRSLAEIDQSHGDRIRNTCRQSADYIEATEQKLHDFRQEVSDALRVTDEMVERLAKYIANEEALNCKTLDAAVEHRSNWRRIIPEAQNMLRAALEARGLDIREKNDGQ